MQGWKQRTEDRVTYRSLQSAGKPLDAVLFEGEGQMYSGADAIVELTRYMRRARWIRPLARFIPGMMPVLRAAYSKVASCRACAEKFQVCF